AHSPHVGARYRIHRDSLSRRDPARFWRDVLLNATQIEALWQARGPLSPRQRKALAGIYDNVGRALLHAGDAGYFEALDRQSRLGEKLSLHTRPAGPLARRFGIEAARQVIGFLGR